MVRTNLKLSLNKRYTHYKRTLANFPRLTPAKRIKYGKTVTTQQWRTPQSSAKKEYKTPRLGRTPLKLRKELFSNGTCSDADVEWVDDSEFTFLHSRFESYQQAQVILDKNDLGDFLPNLFTALTAGSLPLNNIISVSVSS